MNEMSVMGGQGDTRHQWDPESHQSVEAARAVYDEYTSRGFRAFKMEPGGTRGEILSAFDANAGAILLIPPMAGG